MSNYRDRDNNNRDNNRGGDRDRNFNNNQNNRNNNNVYNNNNNRFESEIPQSNLAPRADAAKPNSVNREKITPFLLRVFYKIGSHHPMTEYDFRVEEPKYPAGLIVYTWKDATVRELIDLIRSAVPAAKQRDARISVGLVYVDSQGKPSIREISTAVSTRSGKDDAKTLDELRFEVGDCLSFAIHPA